MDRAGSQRSRSHAAWLIMSFSSGRWTAEQPTYDQPVVKLDASRSPPGRRRPLDRVSVRPTMRTSRFRRCPAELVDAVLIQPAHAERHSALLATGRVWKTHVVSSSVPDQVTIAFGSDPARELVWTWRTSARHRVDCHSHRPTARRRRRRASTDAADAGTPFRVVTGESTPVEVRQLAQ